jgi:class 3 adenylate cyclase
VKPKTRYARDGDVCIAYQVFGNGPVELVHTGEVELLDGDLAGLAVHIGARVAAAADTGEVLVSGTVKELVVGSGIEFADRGEHQLKGVPGTWKLYSVER